MSGLCKLFLCLYFESWVIKTFNYVRTLNYVFIVVHGIYRGIPKWGHAKMFDTGVLLPAHENFAHQELFGQNNWECISLVSQTPADVAAVVWFWLNMHKCICNGVRLSLFLMCVFGLCAESRDSWLLPLFTRWFPVVLWGRVWLPTLGKGGYWEL